MTLGRQKYFLVKYLSGWAREFSFLFQLANFFVADDLIFVLSCLHPFPQPLFTHYHKVNDMETLVDS